MDGEKRIEYRVLSEEKVKTIVVCKELLMDVTLSITLWGFLCKQCISIGHDFHFWIVHVRQYTMY